MKYAWMAMLLLLAGCGDGYWANEICLERDIVGGKCKSVKYFCGEPMVLDSDSKRNPICVMPKVVK